MNATKIDQRPKCSVCGGFNVETTAWIEYREDGTAAIVNGEGPFEGPMGNWCHDCDEHLDLDYPDFTPADRAAVAAADRAREHGPALLAAIQGILDAGEYDDAGNFVIRCTFVEADGDFPDYIEAPCLAEAHAAILKAGG